MPCGMKGYPFIQVGQPCKNNQLLIHVGIVFQLVERIRKILVSIQYSERFPVEKKKRGSLTSVLVLTVL